LVVDDKSPDGTAAILTPIARDDRRLRIIRLSQNAGVHRARIAGVSSAKGEVIGFVDADDWIKPDMIKTMLQRLQSDRADIAICGAEHVSDDGIRIGRKVRFDSARTIDGDVLSPFCRMKLGSGVLWNKLYRRDVIVPAATAPLESEVDAAEDYIVNIGAFAAARRVSIVPAYFYCYRHNPDSASRAAGSAKSFARVLRAYAACLEAYAECDLGVLRNIYQLYRHQLRWDCYRVLRTEELANYAAHLAESLRRIAVTRPHSVHSLVLAFDPRYMHEKEGWRWTVRSLVRRIRAAAWRLRRNGDA
jgi:glycosyltransferase involved in cell wall biosynthesis